jgi:hypothetical protein
MHIRLPSHFSSLQISGGVTELHISKKPDTGIFMKNILLKKKRIYTCEKRKNKNIMLYIQGI